MRNCFFDKGHEVKTPFGDFIVTYNKLDSHNYCLEKIENCSNTYVYDSYASFEDSHFLRYYTCWEEEESVLKKPEKEENIESKGEKTKLLSFLSKKKAGDGEPLIRKNEVKSKKDIQPKKQEFVKVKVVYVQLEAFKIFEFSENVAELKVQFAIIYLLAQAVNKLHGIWPNMIPVISNDHTVQFVKKGGTRNQELIRLFNEGMKGRQIGKWSSEMSSIYEVYEKNGDLDILGSKLDSDLNCILSAEYEVTLVTGNKNVPERAKIISPQVILLINSGYELPLPEFHVSFSYIDQSQREVTLEHSIEDPIVLIGESSNFILRYLKTFRIK